jgi:hypothetical protein
MVLQLAIHRITIFGNGSSVVSYTIAELSFMYVTTSGTSNTFSSTEIYIPNYTSSNNKSVSVDSVTENNATGNIMI